ncbi:MAG: ricin-type beta-trefoil lectin domain protein [bacterium]|nr:ricin-type beta-trefoil lectin domain protein [bacterium]
MGGEFQISTIIGNQLTPSVSALADGGFVVVWCTSDWMGLEASVQGRRYAADGSAVGEEFRINTYSDGSLYYPAVAYFTGGGFVAVWESWGSSGSDSWGYSVQGRRYAADGTAVGEQFQVNTYTVGLQWRPAVATFADGGFATVWQGRGPSGSTYSIQGQRYAINGSPLGGEFQVNSDSDRYQGWPSVAPLANSGFVVVWDRWMSSRPNEWSFNIRGQRFTCPRFALVGLAEKCLDVEQSGTTPGTPVILYRCHGEENQRFELELSSVSHKVVGIGGQCLVPGPVDDTGYTRVVTGDCGGGDDLWRWDTANHAKASTLIHDQTGMCLDVRDNATADFTPIILFDCHGEPNQLWRPAAQVCTRDSLGLCLNQERFRVDLEWHSFDGTTGSGKAVPVGSDDSGLLWFFEADNWEMLIKVLDGCAFNDRLWVFAAATTTVEYTVRVTDTQVGAIREYHNELGEAADAITDTDAFDTCPAGSAPVGSDSQAGTEEPTGGGRTAAESARETATGVLPLKGSCVPSETRMCLAGGRFSVEVAWRDYDDNTGPGRVVDAPGTEAEDTSGMFWFFNSANWEMLVKVLDACDVNGKFLFLGAASTDVEYTLTVTDTDTGDVWQHTNPLGQASEALVHWFDTCQ